VAHWLTSTQGPSNGQLKKMMEFLMIKSSQMDCMSRIYLQHNLGPRLPKTSSCCQEAHGVQHAMTAFNFIAQRKHTKTVKMTKGSCNIAAM
jgi:hypothetical protein